MEEDGGRVFVYVDKFWDEVFWFWWVFVFVFTTIRYVVKVGSIKILICLFSFILEAGFG